MATLNEEWKFIPGYEGYYKISNLGNARSCSRVVPCKRNGTRKIKGRDLKARIGTHGYRAIFPCINGKSKTLEVHSAVAQAFLNHIPTGDTTISIDHIDGNSLNNTLDNLRITNHTVNMRNCDKCKSAKGWYKPKGRNRYMAQITMFNKTTYLGSYKTPEEAAEAYRTTLNNYLNENNYGDS